MWIFTKHGFFSAVCARQGDGKHNQPADPDRIMVRGRLRSHLVALKERFSDVLDGCEIRESSGTDYAFRMFVSKSIWIRVLAALGEETDYDNFKSEVGNHQGASGAAYERSLHDVWSVMHELQKSEGMLPITTKQIDAILPFLERFSTTGFSSGTMKIEPCVMPYVIYDESVVEFVQSLYGNGWVSSAFDWTEWQESAQEFVDSPKKIEKADAATIRKLFTTHVRADRFTEGHLAAMFENGHVLTLLLRLKAIRSKLR